jgi:hypothetical protein
MHPPELYPISPDWFENCFINEKLNCNRLLLCFRYLWSGLIVVVGIYLNICSKNQSKIALQSFLLKFRRFAQRTLLKIKIPSYSVDRNMLSNV